MWSALKYVASPWQQHRENTGFDKRVRKLSRRGGGGQGTFFFSQDEERGREKKTEELEGAAAACFHSDVDAGQEQREADWEGEMERETEKRAFREGSEEVFWAPGGIRLQ